MASAPSFSPYSLNDSLVTQRFDCSALITTSTSPTPSFQKALQRRLLIRPAASSVRSQYKPLDCWHSNHTSDHSVAYTRLRVRLQMPELTSLFLQPWQQPCSSPHTLLTVSSILKGVSGVTDRVIYHTCHQAKKGFCCHRNDSDLPDGGEDQRAAVKHLTRSDKCWEIHTADNSPS